jgi:hypothetical protein
VKPPANPYLKRIASSVGQQDLSRAIGVFVSARRVANESLDNVARKLGISRIIEQRLPFEGGLFKLPDGELVIKLNSDSSFVRKRFTLAHEIGHLLLNTVPALRSSHQRADEALERACDLIAAELLMPTEETTKFVKEIGSPTAEKLKDIASKFRVSLQTAAIRVQSGLGLWKCAAGMWGGAPRFRTFWFVGPRRWDEPQPDTGSLRQVLESQRPLQTKDLWRRRDSTETVWLDLAPYGTGSVVGLVDFVKSGRGTQEPTR